MAAADTFDADQAAAVEQLERLVRRLRSLSPRALHDRRGAADALLSDLVALAAQLEQRSLEAPLLADHVLADAIAVIGGDVLAQISAEREVAALATATRVLRCAMTATR